MKLPNGQWVSESELVDFLVAVFKANGLDVQVDFAVSSRRRADLLIRGDDRRGTPDVLIEVKNITPQTHTRLTGVVEQLHLYGDEYKKLTGRTPVLTLATPGVLSVASLDYLRERGVSAYDRAWIAAAAKDVGLDGRAAVLLGPLDAARGEQHDRGGRKQDILRSAEEELATRLKAIQAGRSYWNPYQQICLEILNHLFSPPLELGIWERANAAKINRRDIIMPNYSTDGFWYYLRQAYRADHIVVDAKNFASDVSKNQVLQMANYLSRHGTGLFGMIITRKGGDKSALYVRREQWIMHDKMILVLNDADLVQMLSNRSTDEPPESLIQQKIEDFRLDI
ncbi:hypothetical protein C8D88_1234 [Lentzea atacamensis]|uniref:Restriction endonuclease type IV Mrr domain-containing protein n=1 Tax=Lentzea atacamensis TaxID=531938 RepID=A0A316HKT8_9PSEU|nr:hypothetical protein [Lentzea atacamensis]PWK80640.1 hypothetical protein C8D88_1234 [Lentzea atacamensis]